MSNVSTDLLWLLVRSNNCQVSSLLLWAPRRAFGLTRARQMEKRSHGGLPTFSKEKGNLRNLHGYKSSGLIHPKTLAVYEAKSGKGVTLVTRRTKATRGQVHKSNDTRNLRANSGQRRTLKMCVETLFSSDGVRCRTHAQRRDLGQGLPPRPRRRRQEAREQDPRQRKGEEARQGPDAARQEGGGGGGQGRVGGCTLYAGIAWASVVIIVQVRVRGRVQ